MPGKEIRCDGRKKLEVSIDVGMRYTMYVVWLADYGLLLIFRRGCSHAAV